MDRKRCNNQPKASSIPSRLHKDILAWLVEMDAIKRCYQISSKEAIKRIHGKDAINLEHVPSRNGNSLQIFSFVLHDQKGRLTPLFVHVFFFAKYRKGFCDRRWHDSLSMYCINKDSCHRLSETHKLIYCAWNICQNNGVRRNFWSYNTYELRQKKIYIEKYDRKISIDKYDHSTTTFFKIIRMSFIQAINYRLEKINNSFVREAGVSQPNRGPIKVSLPLPLIP